MQIIGRELARGAEIAKEVLDAAKAGEVRSCLFSFFGGMTMPMSLTLSIMQTIDWSKLFEKDAFFLNHRRFLRIDASAKTPEDLRKWCESLFLSLLRLLQCCLQ